jgi:DNA-binding transcriptional ArsR family regulator
VELDELADCLEKLGNRTRLAIFRLLVRAGPEGLPVGELQSRLDIPASTLSHHILFLVTAQLIHQQREGRVLRCTPNYGRMHAVVAALTAECCAGLPARSEAVPARSPRKPRRAPAHAKRS